MYLRALLEWRHGSPPNMPAIIIIILRWWWPWWRLAGSLPGFGLFFYRPEFHGNVSTGLLLVCVGWRRAGVCMDPDNNITYGDSRGSSFAVILLESFAIFKVLRKGSLHWMTGNHERSSGNIAWGALRKSRMMGISDARNVWRNDCVVSLWGREKTWRGWQWSDEIWIRNSEKYTL